MQPLRLYNYLDLDLYNCLDLDSYNYHVCGSIVLFTNNNYLI